MANRELAFQRHILDSYKLEGGFGFKWSSEWQAGPPDLVLALPVEGLHLMEVKHRPTWSTGREYKNPLSDKQQDVAEKYTKAGAIIVGGVIMGEKAIKSRLGIFWPVGKTVTVDDYHCLPYNYGGPGTKYPVTELIRRYLGNE